MTDAGLHGIVAEFETPDGLVIACRKAHDAGYRRMDAYTPFPLEEAADAIGFKKTQVPLLTLVGGILGGLSGFFTAVLDSRLRVSSQHRRPPAEFLAVVHRDHLRADDSVCRRYGGGGHVDLERPAAALSPDLQPSALQRRQPRPLLPLHRGRRSSVRAGGDETLSGRRPMRSMSRRSPTSPWHTDR